MLQVFTLMKIVLLLSLGRDLWFDFQKTFLRFPNMKYTPPKNSEVTFLFYNKLLVTSRNFSWSFGNTYSSYSPMLVMKCVDKRMAQGFAFSPLKHIVSFLKVKNGGFVQIGD